MNIKVSTGLKGFDHVIDMLRMEDNVVWQVESIDAFRKVVDPYLKQAQTDQRNIVYIRFSDYPPLVPEQIATSIYQLNATEGFESFASKVHQIIKSEGRKAFYVFDCLSDLLEYWHSDLMIGNFFRVTCPYLFQLDTVAYFCLIRHIHTYDTIARIRETTQLLLDLYVIDEEIYIHPLKVWERYSPTMFFPHLIKDEEALSITSSSEAAKLFSSLKLSKSVRDYWEITLQKAREALYKIPDIQEYNKRLLLELMVGHESKIFQMCCDYFTLSDVLNVAEREIGTGRIGGKSVGMLLARQILWRDAHDALKDHWESHDSYYLGADVFYTYIVQNDLWYLRVKQKSEEGFFQYADELKEKLLRGQFPKAIRDQFQQILEYFGQSPIIVRSSSLLEDNYGNAFAGKYDSIFLANQGTPEERFEAFEDAVRQVYASTMNHDALAYRKNRGLIHHDEQMAILIQRVSGDHYGEAFFPHVAGMGNSTNLYVWNSAMNPEAGMIRLVLGLGLGTRAVDRVSEDYARIIALDMPRSLPPVNYGDESKYNQHYIDYINLKDNKLDQMPVEKAAALNLKTDKKMFFTADYQEAARLRELGYDLPVPQSLDFKKLLAGSFPAMVSVVMKTLTDAYQYPVDIEFAANIAADGQLKFSLLQCRPLQTKGIGRPVKIPEPPAESVLFQTRGNFMGGNIYQPIEYIIFVKGKEYLNLSQQDKYQTARYIGKLNRKLKDRQTLLMGPGRWGTTTPSLGIPVHFTELCHMNILCEVAYLEEGLMPELSFGSHFFQDVVESDIFYAAIFDGDKNVTFHIDRILEKENVIEQFLSVDPKFTSVIQVARFDHLKFYADIISQKLICAAMQL